MQASHSASRSLPLAFFFPCSCHPCVCTLDPSPNLPGSGSRRANYSRLHLRRGWKTARNGNVWPRGSRCGRPRMVSPPASGPRRGRCQSTFLRRAPVLWCTRADNSARRSEYRQIKTSWGHAHRQGNHNYVCPLVSRWSPSFDFSLRQTELVLC